MNEFNRLGPWLNHAPILAFLNIEPHYQALAGLEIAMSAF
jgi:hypothetical protein